MSNIVAFPNAANEFLVLMGTTTAIPESCTRSSSRPFPAPIRSLPPLAVLFLRGPQRAGSRTADLNAAERVNDFDTPGFGI
jgi:hypothetical protein